MGNLWDYDKLRTELASVTRTFVQRLATQAQDEQLYAIGLYTTPDAAYVLGTANSEESESAGSDDLRWSPCDWKYHGYEESLFEGAQQLLDQMSELAIETLEVWEKHQERLLEVMLEVLEGVDREGLIGDGSARSQVLLLLLMGDQSDEQRVSFARRLNPPDALQQSGFSA